MILDIAWKSKARQVTYRPDKKLFLRTRPEEADEDTDEYHGGIVRSY